jgi:hypothetical protein
MKKIVGSESISQKHGSAEPNPDPYRNVTDPEHCFNVQVPVHEDTILRIFLIGLHKSLPLNGQDCLTIAETMIKRAAGLHALASKGFPILYRWAQTTSSVPVI